MSKFKKLDPSKHTKADLMRHALRAQPDITRFAAGEIYGDLKLFASSQFSAIKTEIKEELKTATKKAKATKKTSNNGVNERCVEVSVATPSGNITVSEIEKLRHDNTYLQWQLAGERQGFFEHWLEENDE